MILSSRTYCSMICKFLGHCHLAETVMIPSILLIFILFCFDFRNATPLLFCPPSLVKQKLKDIETCRDKQDKLDKEDKQDGPQLPHSIKHHLNFISDSFLAESHDNLFSPALKTIIEKYWIRPDNVLPNTIVLNKGIIFKLWGGPVFLCDIREKVLYIYWSGP